MPWAMNKHVPAAVLAVRLMGLFFVVTGLWMLLSNIIESVSEFNPSYPGYYLQSQALRPLLAMVLGLFLWWMARPLGRRAARALDKLPDA